MRLNYEREDALVVHEAIEKGIVFRGTNLWVLIFAILVASVGLNMNSTAVVIGAMLISPLMGPINGVGYAVATYNFGLLRRSLKNLGFAAGAGLLASTVYFLISPIHTEHSELLARTSPTIYDVFIALFGGLAGIIALSSKNKGNVIPGVAIATALMPPLCTAGYGLAIANFAYFFGALYLFFINSVFIALSALIITQLLRFPKQTHLLSREIKNKNLAIGVLLTVTVLPSIYFGYILVKREQFASEADEFVKEVSIWEGNYLLSHSIDSKTKKILLVYGGNELDSAAISMLDEKVHIALPDAKLKVKQGLKFNELNLTTLPDNQQEIRQLKAGIMMREKTIDSLLNIEKTGQQLLNEAKALFPVISSCSFASTMRYVDSLDKGSPGLIVIFEADSTIAETDKIKIEKWMKKRLKTDDLIIRF